MFEDYPKNVKLRDDQEVIIRQMIKQDEEALFAFFNSIGSDEVSFLKEDVSKAEVIHRWAETLDYNRVIPILATKDGQIIGDATLHRDQYGWSRHVGEIRIVTHPDYRKKGLGTLLAREIFFLALKIKLDKVMAHVIEGQKGAIQVFTKLGFNQEAVLHDHATDKRGKKHNLVIMSQNIVDFWRRIQDMYEECSSIRSGTIHREKDTVM